MSEMSIKYACYLTEGGVEQPFLPITSESAVVDENGKKLSQKIGILEMVGAFGDWEEVTAEAFFEPDDGVWPIKILDGKAMKVGRLVQYYLYLARDTEAAFIDDERYRLGTFKPKWVPHLTTWSYRGAAAKFIGDYLNKSVGIYMRGNTLYADVDRSENIRGIYLSGSYFT